MSESPRTLLEFTSGDSINTDISWSPTGEWIAYQDAGHIAIVGADGTSRRDLVAGRGRALAWSHDGRTLYAITGGDDTNPGLDFMSVDVASGRVLTRRKLDPKLRPESPFTRGLRMSLSGDGTRC